MSPEIDPYMYCHVIHDKGKIIIFKLTNSAGIIDNYMKNNLDSYVTLYKTKIINSGRTAGLDEE